MADTDVFGDTSAEKMSTEDLTEGTLQEDITDVEPSKKVKEELLKTETEELKPDSSVQETVDENGDVFEETTQVTRKVVKRTMKITETSSTTKTTTMTTPAKLYGKDLSEYDEVDVDALLAQLSPEEINILAKEVDPDDNFLPPNQRCSYECTKDPTGPLNRKKLIDHINKEALETPDLPEIEPFVKGTVRGKKWVPPPRDDREIAADEQIAIDMGEEYEHALSDATQEEIIDLAAILGFHSMMNQDQYHASLLNKGQPIGMGWDGITKSTTQKLYPMDPPNNTDVEESVKRVKEDDPKLIELNLNNIKNISDEKFEQLCNVLPQNEHLEVLSLTNVGLTDKTALLLAEAIEKSKTLRVLNVETNFISPPVIVTLVKALLKARTIEEFRASNQRSTVLGNKIEMEITDLVEKNTSLLRLGLHLEFNDARHRVAAHLQRNIDRNEHEMRKGNSLSPIPKSATTISQSNDLLSMQKARSPKSVHLVLTPQERIDSKSELIASLVSQKQSDRALGEISLAVPQNCKDVRSPIKESKSPIKESISKVLAPIDDKKSVNKPVAITLAKEVLPNPHDVKDIQFPIKENVSPVKVKEPIKLVETKKLDVDNVQKTIAREVPPSAQLLLEEPASIEKRVSVDPLKITDIRKTVEMPVFEKKVSPTRNPKIGELRHSRLSRALDEEFEKKSQIESALKETENPPEASKKIESVISEAEKEIAKPDTLPDSVQKTEDKNPLQAAHNIQPEELTLDLDNPDSDELSKNRDRSPGSVSPNNNLEDKMSLLRAKIDSFAEIADEKIASLRSKVHDISREPLDQPPEISNKQIQSQKPTRLIRPLEALAKISEPSETVPTNLPPKPPTKSFNVPILPLVSTPNSVGITLIYQKQIFKPSEIIASDKKLSQIADVIQNKEIIPESIIQTPLSLNEKEKDITKISVVKTSSSLNQNPHPTLVKAKEISTMERSTEKISEISNPTSENRSVQSETVKSIDSKNTKSDDSSVIAERVTITATAGQNPKTDKPIGKVNNIENPQINENLNVSKTVNPSRRLDPIKEEKPQLNNLFAVEPPFEPKNLNPVKKTIDLSLLSVKKGDMLSIDPINTAEAQTQSQPKPSRFLRLSVKKGDPQKIDPVKMTETSTQTIAKPSPMSLLSIKKGEIITINPIDKSEVSTQFTYEKPQSEASSQTIEEDPTETLEDSTQTPLVFSSLEHDYIFPGLRRVPNLPRPKSINIGSGDRVIVKPSSKPINEILMLLYPVLHDYSKPKETKAFGLEEDLIKRPEPDNTIKDLEDNIKLATEKSKTILNAPPKISEEPDTAQKEIKALVRTEIEIPLVEETKPEVAAIISTESPKIASEARYETKFTAVEKVSAISRTTIENEEHVKFIDKAYKSVAEVSTSEAEKFSKTSIKSANMWESLSSNLIKASEQTLLDISRASEMGEGSNRTKIGKVSVYSSIEDLSRSKFSDRHLGTLIKTVETTSVYSSMEDIPYTKYSDRYKDGKIVSTSSVYSSTEDLPQSSSSKYTIDLSKPIAKPLIYSSMEDISDASHMKFSDRHSDVKASHYTVELPKEKISLLPRSKFSDRYKDDQSKFTHPHPQIPTSSELSHVSSNIDRSYYKSAFLADHSTSRSHYKSTEELLQRSKIGERSTHDSYKSHDSSLQTSIQSAISRNQSALRPYTYVPTLAHTDLSIDHVRPRPTSPSTHTSTLQLNISPSGISELPPTRTTRYSTKDIIDKPIIKISRVRDDPRSFRTISPIEKRPRPSKNFLSPYHHVSDPTNDDESTDESSQPSLDISSASTADNNTSATPKKRANIMDTIKMLKNRVRDVISTEDRFTESHRLPSSSSLTQSSSSLTRRGSRTGTRTNIPYDDDEKEI